MKDSKENKNLVKIFLKRYLVEVTGRSTDNSMSVLIYSPQKMSWICFSQIKMPLSIGMSPYYLRNHFKGCDFSVKDLSSGYIF